MVRGDLGSHDLVSPSTAALLAIAFVAAQVLAVIVWSAPAEFRVLPSVLLITATASAPLVASRLFRSTHRALLHGLVFAYSVLGLAGIATALLWSLAFLQRGFTGFGTPDVWGAAMAVVAVAIGATWIVGTRMALQTTWTAAAWAALPLLTIVAAVMTVAFFVLVSIAVRV